MDEWTFLDEVDVLSKWPAEHRKVVTEGGKWSERRDALEALNKLMEENPRLSTTSLTIYGELMDELRKILDRESNIVVVSTAARTAELLAQGLRTKFGPFVGMVLPFLIKRSKDKKKNVRDAVSSALFAVSQTTIPERIQKDLMEGMALPSPEVKQTLLEFIYKYCKFLDAVDVPFFKAVTPLVVKMASDSDVTVRDKACAALGSIRRLLGPGAAAFLGPIATDNAKMEKIEQYEKQAREEWEAENAEKAKARPAQTGATGDEAQEENGEETASGASQIVTSTAIDPWTLLDPVDVTANVPKTVETQLVDKNWKERLEGCETLKKAVDAVGRCEISERTREIAVVLVKIIEKDVNVNVASCAAEVLAGLAVKARFSFSPIAIRLFPVSFDKLKDKKQVLRDALNSLIDSAATTTTLTNYTEALSAALTGKNPQTRAQTAAFLARVIAKNDSTTMDIDGLKALIEAVSKAANDADKDVREETLRIVAATSKCVGDKIAQRLFSEIFEDKLKADRIPQMVEELEKTYGKIASEEMKRLAENSGVGGGPAPSKKPTSAAAPVKKAVPSAAVAPRPRPAPPAARPAPPKPAVAPFVARPAPPKPVVAAATPAARSVQVRPKPAPTPVRTASSSSMKPLPRVAGLSSKPIVTPNVVQRPTSAPKPALSRPTSASRPAFVARPAPKFAAITSKINNVGTSISSSRPAPNVVKNSTLEGATQRASSAAATTRYNRPNVVTTTTTTTVKTMADDGIIKRQPLKIAPAPAGAAPTRSALPTGVRLPSARQHSLTKFDPQLKRSLSNLTGIPKPISRTPSQQNVGQPFPDLKLNKLKLSNGSLGPIE